MHQEDGMPVSTEGLNDRLRSQTRTATPQTAPPPTLFRLPNLNPSSDNTAEAPTTVAENFLADAATTDATVQRRFDSATTATEPAQQLGSIDEPTTETLSRETSSSESDTASIRLFDEGDSSVPAPALASRLADTEPYKRTIFEKVGSQTIVLGGLALLAGAAMLANQNRAPEAIDAPIIEHQVESQWPANQGKNPAVVATDSTFPASANDGIGADNALTPNQPFNPAEQAFANPASEPSSPYQHQVSQTGDNDDSLHLGSYHRDTNAGTPLTPLVNQDKSNTGGTSNQGYQDQPNEPFVPSGTYDAPGPNEIPVDPIPTPGDYRSSGDFSAPGNFSSPTEPDTDFSGQQRSLRPEMPDGLAAPNLREQAVPNLNAPEMNTSEANIPAQAAPRPTVQLNRPTSPDGLRYSNSPLPIDWNRYISQLGNTAEPARPAAQTASPASSSQTR